MLAALAIAAGALLAALLASALIDTLGRPPFLIPARPFGMGPDAGLTGTGL